MSKKSSSQSPASPAENDDIQASQGELVLYTSEDGLSKLHLRAEGGTVWLAQQELAELFQSSKQNISLHIKNILEEKELDPATVKEYLTVQTEGQRQVRRSVRLYNLDMILAVGYRVKSPRGTQFRQWATTQLREYLVKGFVLDDARLKEPGGWDYFDELLQRIRDIRASEKRFYQKVRDVFALSVDYKNEPEATGVFFATVQNKMLYATTGKTAAELIIERADPDQPNMNLTNWSGSRVRKTDVVVAKNYLKSKELDSLNRLSTLFLDFAELRASQRKEIRMEDWRSYVDNFVEFNEFPVLKTAGRISHDRMQQVAHERYEQFDSQRKLAEAKTADEEDIKALVEVEQKGRKGGKNAP